MATLALQIVVCEAVHVVRATPFFLFKTFQGIILCTAVRCSTSVVAVSPVAVVGYYCLSCQYLNYCA